MRAALVLVILAVLAAGCAKSNTPTPATASTPSSTPASTPAATTPAANATPTPAATPTTTATPTPTPPTNETPTRTTYNVTLTHDYAATDENLTLDIPATALPVNLTLFFHVAATGLPAGAPYACGGADRMQVYAPDGTLWADVHAAAATAQDNNTQCGVVSADVAQTVTHGPVVAGVWHVQFSGPGTGYGIVEARQPKSS